MTASSAFRQEGCQTHANTSFGQAALQPSREQGLTPKTRNLYNSPMLFKIANINLVVGPLKAVAELPPFGKDRLTDDSLGATSLSVQC